MEKDRWRLEFAARFDIDERIGVLEGRATIAAFRHKLRAVRNFGIRHLNLGDNLGLILGMIKGRTRSFALLHVCRRLLVLSVAGNSRFYHR